MLAHTKPSLFSAEWSGRGATTVSFTAEELRAFKARRAQAASQDTLPLHHASTPSLCPNQSSTPCLTTRPGCIHLSCLSLRASSPAFDYRVSRSASEPDKGRLIFQFPRSPTVAALSSLSRSPADQTSFPRSPADPRTLQTGLDDAAAAAAAAAALHHCLDDSGGGGGGGAAGLSSVLHVEENALSSDDFHEALFLAKSPKMYKRKRSRKRDKALREGGGAAKAVKEGSREKGKEPTKDRERKDSKERRKNKDSALSK